MKKAAFLTMDSLNGFECYDHLLFKPLKKLGWDVEEVSWKKDKNWQVYDAVIVRSAWDYQNDPYKFFDVLEKINSASHLENKLSIMKWNLNKNYLNDLREKDINIVETIFEKEFIEEKVPEYFKLLDSNQIVIKPNISANSDNTFRWELDSYKWEINNAKNIFENREFLVQPFIKNIIDEGEYSLFYFGGIYSHTIVKKPKENDFRVQEEHGGRLYLIDPLPGQRSTAENILKKLDNFPLYARIDLVRDRNNNFALMELELIEPSLYFNMDKNSPARFAEIFNEWMINQPSKF